MAKKYCALILAVPLLTGMGKPARKLPILTPKITRYQNSEFLIQITYDATGTPHVRATPVAY